MPLFLIYIFEFQFASQECLHCKWLKCCSNQFKKEGERVYWLLKPGVQRQIWPSGIARSGHSNSITRSLLSCSLSYLLCILRQSLWECQNYILIAKSSQQTKGFLFPHSTKKSSRLESDCLHRLWVTCFSLNVWLQPEDVTSWLVPCCPLEPGSKVSPPPQTPQFKIWKEQLPQENRSLVTSTRKSGCLANKKHSWPLQATDTKTTSLLKSPVGTCNIIFQYYSSRIALNPLGSQLTFHISRKVASTGVQTPALRGCLAEIMA